MNGKNVIFSNDKRFYLDRPCSFKCYQRDLRIAKDIRWSRSFKDGSLMLWGAVSPNGKTDLVVVQDTKNTEV